MDPEILWTDEEILWADLDEMIDRWEEEEFINEIWPAMVAALNS